MANPSLQIGNGKFAIKENDLLGYSSSGTRFFPIPITMTRATLGTRVNSSGLIEDVALLGGELVSCGDFACADPDAVWNRGTGWTIASGLASCDGTQTGNTNLSQFGVFSSLANKSIKLSFTVSNYSAGSVRFISGNGALTHTAVTQNGTVTLYFNVGANSGTSFNIQGDVNFVGSVDNVSVKEATIDGLARVDYTDGTGSLLVEPQRTNKLTNSEDFTSWTKSGTITTTPNYGISPNGTQDSTRVVFDNSNNAFYKLSVHSGNTETNTIYVKGVSGETIKFGKGTTVNAGDIFTLNENWQRLEHVSTTGNQFTINTYSGSTARDIQIWGTQIEEGSYPTSYIKTQGSTVTRNKDQYTKTGISDKINSEEGVLFVEMAALSDDNTDRRISLNDGSANNEIEIGYSRFTGSISGEVASGGSLQNINFGATGVTQTDNNKFALSWGGGTLKFYVNGSQTNIETGITSPVGLNTLKFSKGNDTEGMFAKVKQLQVFKTALSDSELATLTT